MQPCTHPANKFQVNQNQQSNKNPEKLPLFRIFYKLSAGGKPSTQYFLPVLQCIRANGIFLFRFRISVRRHEFL